MEYLILGHVILLAICINAGLQSMKGQPDFPHLQVGLVVFFIPLEIIYWILYWILV